MYRITSLDWKDINSNLHKEGFALVSSFLSNKQCNALREIYHTPSLYRKHIDMARYRFGQGEYKYFGYPLPSLIQTIREEIYPNLALTANRWMEMLNTNQTFPVTHQELQAHCRDNHQTEPTPLILRYEKGGYNTLHQDLYGEVFFPIQLVIFLSEPNDDYTGGEFVLLEQRPRAQSKATVLLPRQGDMLFFATRYRPLRSARGFYRATMKHGVSEVKEGERYTLGIIFHDALS